MGSVSRHTHAHTHTHRQLHSQATTTNQRTKNGLANDNLHPCRYRSTTTSAHPRSYNTVTPPLYKYSLAGLYVKLMN